MRRRTRRFNIDTKLIVDVISASLIVQKAPAIINQFFPLDPNIAKIAGVGAGFLTGNLLKRPNISNGSLALGVVDLLTPMFDNLLGMGGGGVLMPSVPGGKQIAKYTAEKTVALNNVSDYLDLDDYVSNPSRREAYVQYKDSY